VAELERIRERVSGRYRVFGGGRNPE